MALDMFHANEVAKALRLLCQSAVALTADCNGSDTVTVGSNQLFGVGDSVALVDDDSAAETRTVQGKTGLTTITLNSAVSGNFEVAENARIALATPRLADLKFVLQGPPEMLPEPRGDQFPFIIVRPGEMSQPPEDGTNKSFDQTYELSVYHVRKYEPGEQPSVAALDDAATLFNLLMEDTYLGGTAWYSQVTKVDPNDPFGERLRGRGLPLTVVRLDLIARRREAWAK